jgi:hypothetical protein
MAIISQLLGAILVALGVGLMFLPAGVVVAGIFAMLFGIALERTTKENK